MIKAIAIDDEPLALKILAHHCDKIEEINLEKTFTNLSEAKTYINDNEIDLIFLDIEMPQQNGIDFYKSLNKKVMVIFTTAYDQYALEGFNVSAIDYIMKPISFDRFKEAVEKVIKVKKLISNKNEDSFIMIRADYKLNKIYLKDIQYIEGLDDYIQIYIDNQPKIVARMSMKAILETLPAKDFIRIHRSFIIPIKRIKNIQNKQIEIDSILIPIGETYKSETLEALKKI
ncbi:DNA-binding response regulator [Paenimyroides tangerinum]|uniref:DNA-binding response regulator n=1 Tax=Paenimyroides tangerinum TaxID=2488728 RepID=A0A3P3WE36_9FLAO|nr:LytTR family DNA-binding domain-containing protein [Paenimyroides tangerinum]RRJ92678.1 DNA-binding response regulator [Paenimyroides tangerinum]